jgi:hypothetical protein
MKLLTYLAIGMATAISLAQSAIAQVPVQKIRTTLETQPPVHLTVYPTNETTINYGSAGETIQKIWLSDLGTVGLDTHGCLEGLHPNCPVSNARFLHIKVLNRQSTKTVGMTVITIDRQNRLRTYLYRLTPSFNSDGDGTNYIEYIPMSSAITSQAIAIKLLNRSETGVREGWIDAPIQTKIQLVAALVGTGKTIEEAAESADISSGFLNSIIQG